MEILAGSPCCRFVKFVVGDAIKLGFSVNIVQKTDIPHDEKINFFDAEKRLIGWVYLAWKGAYFVPDWDDGEITRKILARALKSTALISA